MQSDDANHERTPSAGAADDDEWELRFREPLAHILAEAGDKAGEMWLWCLYCNRFFQAKDLRIDFFGNRQGCACCDCAGFDVAIVEWDAFATEGWPESTDELHHGMLCE